MMTQLIDLATGATTSSGGAKVMEGIGGRAQQLPREPSGGSPSSGGNSSDGE